MKPCNACKGRGEVPNYKNGALYWVKDPDTKEWTVGYYEHLEFYFVGGEAVGGDDVIVGPEVKRPKECK